LVTDGVTAVVVVVDIPEAVRGTLIKAVVAVDHIILVPTRTTLQDHMPVPEW
jgi:hypothetical protein